MTPDQPFALKDKDKHRDMHRDRDSHRNKTAALPPSAHLPLLGLRPLQQPQAPSIASASPATPRPAPLKLVGDWLNLRHAQRRRL
jgi:hypothetical protein